MSGSNAAFNEVVTLRQAKKLIQCMAQEQSFLLLSAPGIGKSEMVYEAAREAGLPCRSLLGTQIAPEDVSGVPRIVGERSVFCPPRILLPERPEPFCLFLDELPACAPDVQKAFYSLLLERRLGEHALPPGTWVVAAGNRLQDRALVRAMSSALVNRVTILQIRHDVDEWLAWAQRTGIRNEIRSFIATVPDALMRPVPADPVPFSTPRSWSQLSRAFDLAQKAGMLTSETRRALAFGRLSPEDAAVFCALAEESMGPVQPLERYIRQPNLLPKGDSGRWFILDCIRQYVRDGRADGLPPRVINRFLRGLSSEHQLILLTDMVEKMGCAGCGSRHVRVAAQGGRPMTGSDASTAADRAALARITRGLRMVTVPFPHLSGLAAAVRVDIDNRVPTMGVFASGRLVANTAFTAKLSGDDLVFVLAHELLHLALRTHDRAKGSAHLEFNYAHDYIINDMLRHSLGVATIPAGGLDMPGARDKSAEEIVVEMRRSGQSTSSRTRVWDGEIVSADKALGPGKSASQPGAGDVLDEKSESEMFPQDSAELAARAKAIRELAARGMAMAKAMGTMRGKGVDPGSSQQNVRALRGIYRSPWQVAVQRWLEGVSPGERTFTPRITAWGRTNRYRDAGSAALFADPQYHSRYKRVDEW